MFLCPLIMIKSVRLDHDEGQAKPPRAWVDGHPSTYPAKKLRNPNSDPDSYFFCTINGTRRHFNGALENCGQAVESQLFRTIQIPRRYSRMGRVSTVMANSRNIVEGIKKDLARVRPQDRPLTTKGIIDALAEDIHVQMKRGVRLDDVYVIIRARLPEETRLTLTTFKRYWRESRDHSGLSKIKKSGRKQNCGEAPYASQKLDHVDVKAGPRRASPNQTVNDFRADPDDI